MQLARHLAAGDDLAEAVGKLRLDPLYFPDTAMEEWSGYTESEDLVRGYLYYLLHEDKLMRVGDRISNRPQIQRKLDVEPFSASTLRRIEDEDYLDDDWTFDADETLREAAEDTVRHLTDTDMEVEGLREPDYPETISDGEGEYPLTLILRDLRKKTYPYIRFNRDKSVMHSKDMLLRVLASAARDYVHLTTAADGLKYKHWLDEDDIPSVFVDTGHKIDTTPDEIWTDRKAKRMKRKRHERNRDFAATMGADYLPLIDLPRDVDLEALDWEEGTA